MRRPIKFAIAAAGILAVLLATFVVLALTVDPTRFKDQIARVITSTTGVELSFGGSIKTRYFPTLGVELNDVTVLAPKEAGGGVLAKLGRAGVSVRIMPLLRGHVEAGQVTMSGLELNLVRDEKGRLNLPVPPIKDVKIENRQVVVITDKDERYALNYEIAGVSVNGASVRFEDRVTGQKIVLRDLNLETGAVVNGKPFPLKLDFAYSLENPEMEGKVQARGNVTAVPEALLFDLADATLVVSASGTGLPVNSAEATCKGVIRVDGRKQIFTGEGLSLTAKAVGGVLPATVTNFSLDAAVKADMSAGTADVTGLLLKGMDMAVKGEAHAVNLNARPKIDFALKSDALNIDRLPLAGSGAKSEPLRREPPHPPVNVPVDATGTVEIGSLTAARLHMKNVSAALALKDGTLAADPVKLSLYGGTVKASGRVGLSGPEAPMAVNVTADGIELEPLLTDLQGKAKLGGRASASGAVTARGLGKQMLATLNGKAAFSVRDGAILGFSFTPEALTSGAGGQGRTVFQSIGGSFAITNGVARNSDFVAEISPHKATGKGEINLAAQTLDYTVQASFAGLPAIPVHLTGALASPGVSVNPAGLATDVVKGAVDVIKDPQRILNAPQNVGKGAGDAVKNLLRRPKR